MTDIGAWPDHLLDLDEWSALGENTSRRIELVEGVLVVAPRPLPRHQMVVTQLASLLDARLRPRWRAVAELEVLVDAGPPPTVRVPDVVVFRASRLWGGPTLDRADVLAVAEVLSPGSRRTDRVAKLADYADAGIEYYLVVDPGPPVTLVEYRLEVDAYALVAHHEGRADLALGPTVDLDTLL